MKISSSKTSWLSLGMIILLFSSVSNAGIALSESFDDGTADGWTFDGNTFIGSDPINATQALLIDTRAPIASAISPVLDLRWLASVTLSFDFAQPAEPVPQATRWVDVEFFDGNDWLRLARLRQNRSAEEDLSFTLTSGFSDMGQFRFLGKGDSGGNRFVAIDNVNVEVVSAPQTLASFGVFALLLLSIRRKS